MHPPPITMLLRPPTVTLTEWTIFEVVLHSFNGTPTWHLVGMQADGHASYPRVSSPLIAVDNVLRTCATRGGDIYHLNSECSIYPGDELTEWAMWKKNLHVQSDKNVTSLITDAFTRLEQQLYDYQSQRPEDFPIDWFVGIQLHEAASQDCITPDAFLVDERHEQCLRLALQCARLYEQELGSTANLRPLYFDTLVQEALHGWPLSIQERRWIFTRCEHKFIIFAHPATTASGIFHECPSQRPYWCGVACPGVSASPDRASTSTQPDQRAKGHPDQPRRQTGDIPGGHAPFS